MSVAYEFLHGNENLEFRCKEDMINFVIDHYLELMKVYRVMKARDYETIQKKISAHENLQKLREDKEFLDASQMTEIDKMALEEKEMHFAKLREEDDIHYYNKKPLEHNQLTNIILRYPRIMILLEKFDTLGRTGLSNLSRKIVEVALFPLRKLTKSAIKQSTPNGTSRGILKGLKSVVDAVPGIVVESILASMNVDLNDHLPDDDDDDDDYEKTFTFEF